MAGRADDTIYFARTAAPAARVGQPHRSEEHRNADVAVPAWHHAALYAARRQLAEHGRVHPAHPQAPRLGGPAPPVARRDRHLVRADRRGLEPPAPPLSGTASAASDGTSGAVTPILSAARRRIRRSRSQAARATFMNGIFQPK